MSSVSESGNPELKTYSVESGKLDHTVKLSVHVLRQENCLVYNKYMYCELYNMFEFLHHTCTWSS